MRRKLRAGDHVFWEHPTMGWFPAVVNHISDAGVWANLCVTPPSGQTFPMPTHAGNLRTEEEHARMSLAQ